jgi:2-polyprenyl-3-methyl-5-hydroxy-6-metoxy-1,4-benzoquinol methylase
MVCAFEVLEHCEDDAKVLADWVARVRPGGRLLISVPAHQDRFGPSDVRVGHFRRYERQQLADLLEAARLVDVEIVSVGEPLGRLLEWAWDQAARLRPHTASSMEDRTHSSGRLFQPPDWMGWTTQAATAPFRRMQRRHLDSDRGTGFVAVGRRAA